jgi:hypothetical protein
MKRLILLAWLIAIAALPFAWARPAPVTPNMTQ